MELITEKFWMRPGDFVSRALKVVRDDKEELYRQLEAAPRFQGFIAVGILAYNPEVHRALQANEGLFRRLKENFDHMPEKLREKARSLVDEALAITREKNWGDMDAAKRREGLQKGRTAIATVRSLLADDMQNGSKFADAWTILRGRIEQVYGPRPGDAGAPPPKAKKLKKVKPQSPKGKTEQMVSSPNKAGESATGQTDLSQF